MRRLGGGQGGSSNYFTGKETEAQEADLRPRLEQRHSRGRDPEVPIPIWGAHPHPGWTEKGRLPRFCRVLADPTDLTGATSIQLEVPATGAPTPAPATFA